MDNFFEATSKATENLQKQLQEAGKQIEMTEYIMRGLSKSVISQVTKEAISKATQERDDYWHNIIDIKLEAIEKGEHPLGRKFYKQLQEKNKDYEILEEDRNNWSIKVLAKNKEIEELKKQIIYDNGAIDTINKSYELATQTERERILKIIETWRKELETGFISISPRFVDELNSQINKEEQR